MIQIAAKIDSFCSDEKQERFGFHYLATCLALAWYYCLWFSPNIFIHKNLLADMVTFSWLTTLATSGVSFLVLSLIYSKTKKSNGRTPYIMIAAAAVATLSTAAYTIWPQALYLPALSLVLFPLLFGISNAIIWIRLGELHAHSKSSFSTYKFMGMFGAVILISITLATVLPHFLAITFVSLMPIASALLYLKANKKLDDTPFLTLLPADTRKKPLRATIIISITICSACAACYFNIAIIPIDYLSPGEIYPNEISYVIGIALSGVLCILISLIQSTFAKNAAAFKLLPWMLVTACIAIAVFVNGDENLYPVSFIISVALAGVFEVGLIAYFGVLSSKGFIATAVAFGLSSAVVRLGFLLGDALAVLYEHVPTLAENFATETSLLSMVVLTCCLIPLLKQERIIIQLIAPPPLNKNEVEEVCDAAITEFALSKREGEILKLLARGYTINSISRKLVISPYTTQTHVRHIYSKMHMHKRSELLDYINMYRSE